MCIHVIYYDDRRYTDPDDPNDPDEDQQPDNSVYPKFEVFYAWAPVNDLDFDPEEHPERNKLLYEIDPDDPNDPPGLDFSKYLWGQFEPGEYIGISAYVNQIWTSFAGTWGNPPPIYESLIWSSRINW